MPIDQPYLAEHIGSRRAWGRYVAIKNELTRQDVEQVNAQLAELRAQIAAHAPRPRA